MNGQDDFSGLGFAEGVVIGARTFKVTDDGWLRGLFYNQIWRPGVNVAECMSHYRTFPIYSAQFMKNLPPEEPRGPHSMEDCKHGFYGYLEGSNDYQRHGPVYGVIEGWGESMHGPRGFRVMKAQILGLHVTTGVALELAAKVAGNYPGIPWFESFEDLVAAIPPQGFDLGSS